jgi:hypothetical protein
MASLTPNFSTPVNNANNAFNNSWLQIENDQNKNLFAQAIYNINDQLCLGQKGATFISTADKRYNGSWHTIQILSDVVFNSIEAGWDGDTDVSDTVFAAGTIIYGIFTEINIKNGKLLAYKN